MALHEWQVALGSMVEAHAAGRDARAALEALGPLELGEAERAWLREVVGTPGFELTSYVPRWWRQVRVVRSARLTLAALGSRREEVVREYLRAVPCFTLFFMTEGLRFLEYVASTTESPHVRAVAQLERALCVLKQAEADGAAEPLELGEPGSGDRLERHPLAALIHFEHAPEAVLGALLRGAPLPTGPVQAHCVLVAPRVPRLWRLATPEETTAFTACERPASSEALMSLPGITAQVVEGLLAVGALRGLAERVADAA